MALVDNGYKIVRKIIEQTERPRTGLTTIEISGIIFDSGAIAQFTHHFHVVFNSFLNAFRFYRFANFLKKSDLLNQVVLNLADSKLHPFISRYKNTGRINNRSINRFNCSATYRINRKDFLNVVAPENNPECYISISRKYIDSVALNPEISTVKFHFVARIQGIDQTV